MKLSKLAKICINGDFEGQGGSGPGGSGPITNNEEIICDILTEIISTLFKMYRRLLETIEKLKYQIEKEKNTVGHSHISARKAASQIEMSNDDGDEIPEQIEKLTETEITLNEIQLLTSEFENTELL